jgi:hypothetical protein
VRFADGLNKKSIPDNLPAGVSAHLVILRLTYIISLIDRFININFARLASATAAAVARLT